VFILKNNNACTHSYLVKIRACYNLQGDKLCPSSLRKSSFVCKDLSIGTQKKFFGFQKCSVVNTGSSSCPHSRCHAELAEEDPTILPRGCCTCIVNSALLDHWPVCTSSVRAMYSQCVSNFVRASDSNARGMAGMYYDGLVLLSTSASGI